MKKMLVLDRKNTELDIENQRLIVRIQEQRPQTIPLDMVDNIIVASPIALQSQLLNRLMSHNLVITFMPSHPSHRVASLIPNQHGNHQRKVLQYQACNNPTRALAIAKAILRTKLFGQLRNTQRWQRSYPQARLALTSAHKNIVANIAKSKHAKNIDTLMGYEGQAAHAYFAAIAAMVAPSYGFTGRKKRPPTDPINAILSYSYTLAQNDIEAALFACGLEPALGFLHQISYGRNSLACDVLELIRPAIDAWVLNLFAKQFLTTDHFFTQDQACLLNKTGREHFYQHWAAKRRILLRHVLRLLNKSISYNGG